MKASRGPEVWVVFPAVRPNFKQNLTQRQRSHVSEPTDGWPEKKDLLFSAHPSLSAASPLLPVCIETRLMVTGIGTRGGMDTCP